MDLKIHEESYQSYQRYAWSNRMKEGMEYTPYQSILTWTGRDGHGAVF